MKLCSSDNHYMTVLLIKVLPLKGGVDLLTLAIQNTLLIDSITYIIWILNNKQMEIKGQK